MTSLRCAQCVRPQILPAAGVADENTAGGSTIEGDIARIIAIGREADNRLEACQQWVRRVHTASAGKDLNE